MASQAASTMSSSSELVRSMRIAAAKRLTREGITVWLGKSMESVAEFIECGECEEKCSYHLPITDLLKENLALYKEYA